MSFTATCERFCVYFLAAACRIMTLSDFSVILEKSRPFPAWKTKKNIIKNLGRNRKKTKELWLFVTSNYKESNIVSKCESWTEVLNMVYKCIPPNFAAFFF